MNSELFELHDIKRLPLENLPQAQKHISLTLIYLCVWIDWIYHLSEYAATITKQSNFFPD